MPRKFAAVFLFLLLSINAAAQDEACAILVYDNSDTLTIGVYGREGERFSPQANPALQLPAADFVITSASSDDLRLAAIRLNADDNSARVEFYQVTPSAVLFQPQAVFDGMVPLQNGFSPDWYLALLDTESEGLFILDTDRHDIVGLAEGMAVSDAVWSPEYDAIAFVARDAESSDLNVAVTEPDGTLLYTYPLDEATFARLGWLSGSQIAVTECVGDVCTAHIADVFTGETQSLELGAHVLEGFSAWRYSYILTGTADRNAALLAANGIITAHTHASSVTARPMLTRDGRYLALRTLEADGQHLLILDLADSMLWRSFPLADPAPDRLFSDSDTGRFPQIVGFGQWHPHAPKFLFSDGGAVHVYDAVRGELETVIEQAGTPQWVCPAAQ